jgi:hypothetical protein
VPLSPQNQWVTNYLAFVRHMRDCIACNLYNLENAWSDASGALYVQIKKKSGRVFRNIHKSLSRVRNGSLVRT